MNNGQEGGVSREGCRPDSSLTIEWLTAIRAMLQVSDAGSEGASEFRTWVLVQLDDAERLGRNDVGVRIGLARREWGLWLAVLRLVVAREVAGGSLESTARRLQREPQVIRRQLRDLLGLGWREAAGLQLRDLAALFVARCEMSRARFRLHARAWGAAAAASDRQRGV